MATTPPLVFVHADESCLGTQFAGRDRPGGAAVLLEHWKDGAWERRDLWTSDPSTTNNRMAITSAILALGTLRGRCRVRFVSDSQYLIKGASEWMPGWKRKGWKRKGGPIENLDLWRRLGYRFESAVYAPGIVSRRAASSTYSRLRRKCPCESSCGATRLTAYDNSTRPLRGQAMWWTRCGSRRRTRFCPR